MRWLIILLLPLGLAGCLAENNQPMPLSLAPADAGAQTCLRYEGSPAYGDCKEQPTVSLTEPAQ